MVELNPRTHSYILSSTRKKLGVHHNIRKMVDWYAHPSHEYDLPYLLESFDLNVQKANDFLSSEIPPQLQTLRELQGFMGGRPLPLVSDLMATCSEPKQKRKTQRLVLDALRTTQERIACEELNFANDVNREKLLSVATLYHVFEELVKIENPSLREANKQKLVRDDLIIEALIEVLMYKTYVLHEIDAGHRLVHPLLDGLNWVRGYIKDHDLANSIPDPPTNVTID